MNEIWGTFIKLLIALPLVLILLVVVLRYSISGYQGRLKMNSNMQIVDQRALNARTILYMVNVQGTYYLLGCQENNIVLIDKLENYEEHVKNEDSTKDFNNLFAKKLTEVYDSVKEKVNLKKGYDGKDEQK